MRSYEMVFIVRPDLEGDDFEEVVADVQDLIERNEGEVTKMEPWGLRRMAYAILDHQEGHYVLTNFELEPRNVTALERAVKLRETIIRHMVIRLDD